MRRRHRAGGHEAQRKIPMRKSRIRLRLRQTLLLCVQICSVDPPRRRLSVFKICLNPKRKRQVPLRLLRLDRKKVATKGTGTGKSGLRATPARKPATTATRGRKPAGPKKAATKPLSPKKTKQMANTLSAYASSDGEEDELNTLKDDIKSPIKLVVHSPVKHGLETTRT